MLDRLLLSLCLSRSVGGLGGLGMVSIVCLLVKAVLRG